MALKETVEEWRNLGVDQVPDTVDPAVIMSALLDLIESRELCLAMELLPSPSDSFIWDVSVDFTYVKQGFHRTTVLLEAYLLYLKEEIVNA